MTPLIFIFIIAALSAYSIGSFSFAIIVSKISGLDDPRHFGSNNPGATNVLRTGSKIAAALTLLGDSAKGWFAIWLALRLLSAQHFSPGIASLLIFIVATAVIIGHMWPLFFGFHGGKGIATALGIMLAFSPWLGLSVLAVWLGIAIMFRISSLAAVGAAMSAPFLALYWLHDNTYIAAIFMIAVLVLRRHKKNILRLIAGQEKKIGQKNIS